MKMFGGLTKTSSRIAIAAALGMTLGGFALHASPAKAADLGGDCCADLEERVAELEATTVRKGNKKVSVTLSGWVVKYGEWWDDGVETNFYVGDKHTTLSSHFQISGSAQIAPGWSAGYTIAVETRGGSTVGDANQFNDDTSQTSAVPILSNISVLLSYMWLKSDKWGTINWGQLSQATDNVALLPDLSGTIIEANAVLFDGSFFFLRPKGAPTNAQGLANITWGAFTQCLENGGGIGADCNGYPQNGVRYDTPTWGGFSLSTGFAEDDVWDVALKYAADWNSVKFSAAAGYTKSTDEGCIGTPAATNCGGAVPGNGAFIGGGGGPNQGYRMDADLFQVGASIMHVPSGLFVYGLYQHEENNGTDLVNVWDNRGSAANDTDVWYIKAGIRRTWSPIGATVLFGQYGQYEDQFSGLQNVNLCAGSLNPNASSGICANNVNAFVTDSTVQRYGVGVVQEIDSAAMHLFFNWEHLNLDASMVGDGFGGCIPNRWGKGCTPVGTGDFKNLKQSFDDLDMFQIGGVIFF
jgi:hypothetical protein